MKPVNKVEIVQKLAFVCAEVFEERRPRFLHDALLILRQLDEDAIEVIANFLREGYVSQGERELGYQEFMVRDQDLPDGWDDCDLFDLLTADSPSSISTAVLEASKDCELIPCLGGPLGPFVSLDGGLEPEYAFDFSLGEASGRLFVGLDIFSAETRWTGIHSLGVFAKSRVATMALTQNSVPQQTLGPKPWFCREPDSNALDHFIRKAKSSSHPYKVCIQCKQVLVKLAFSDSWACDSCLGIIH